MKLYISDLSLVVLMIFYLPLATWLIVSIARHRSLTGVKKMVMAIAATIVAYLIPLGDVTLNSIAMANVCPTAGLHIYKTVKVDGYFDPAFGEHIFKKYPFRFMEQRIITATGTQIARYERKDGEIVRSMLDEPTAEYETTYETWSVDTDLGVERSRYAVRNRLTSETLAERLLFNPLPGWLDRMILIRWFGGALQGCHGVGADGAIAKDVLLAK